MTSVTIRSVPPTATAQQKGVFICNGKPRFFKKKAQAQAENNAIACLVAARPRNMVTYTDPISVSIRLVWPYRKSEKPRIIANGIEVPMGSRPDLDNVCKMLLDALVAANYIADDSLVTTLRLIKRWGPTGLWKVDIQPDGETQRLF